MKIFLANYEPGRIGGGWSFARNFVKGMNGITTNYDEADIYFITSASMVSREDAMKAKEDNKKIVLRVDNILRNSRNRNTGMTRMQDMANLADLVVFQSAAVRNLLGYWLFDGGYKNNKVILNSTDEDIFYNDKVGDWKQYLYSRYNRDETKNWEVARAYFSKQSEFDIKDDPITLNIVGKFSPELVEYNFDFYADEKYKYWGEISNPDTMADLYRKCGHLIYTYWQDACSNTLIEALMCNCTIDFTDDYYRQGSANEIMTLFEVYGKDYFKLHRMCGEYSNAMKGL